jgi:hypothetical protein
VLVKAPSDRLRAAVALVEAGDVMMAVALDSLHEFERDPLLLNAGRDLDEIRRKFWAARRPKSAALLGIVEEVAVQVAFNTHTARGQLEKAFDIAFGSTTVPDARELDELADRVAGVRK